VAVTEDASMAAASSVSTLYARRNFHRHTVAPRVTSAAATTIRIALSDAEGAFDEELEAIGLANRVGAA
jgi:hypothetical protein